MINRDLVVLWVVIIIIYVAVIAICVESFSIINANKDFCVNHDYKYYQEEIDEFISCCNKINQIDQNGEFIKKCEVFQK